MNIAAMRVRITFQRNSAREDDIGNRWNEWEDFFSCWATVGTSSGSETFGAATVNPEESLDFTCRYCTELESVTSTSYRILAEGKVYNINYVNPMGFKRNSLKFNCTLEKPP